MSILDRLNERIAARPPEAETDVEQLFTDFVDARDAILAGYEAIAEANDRNSDLIVPQRRIHDDIAHVHTLLVDAKDRLSVNAIGDVATYINRAVELLERPEHGRTWT